MLLIRNSFCSELLIYLLTHTNLLLCQENIIITPCKYSSPLSALRSFFCSRLAIDWESDRRLCEVGIYVMGIKKHRPEKVSSQGDLSGGCLLSHLRSTIGVTGLNFSVRDGKRWIPGAITTLISLAVFTV